MIEDTPPELVHDVFTETVFGDHPLGRPVLGSAEVIASVSRRAIGAYHRARYRPDNIVVAAAGSVEHDRLVEVVQDLAKKSTAAGARRPVARPPFVSPPPPSLRFVRKETEQYHVCIGAPGLARSDRRRFTATVLDSILGGSASSRLFQEIREKRGLAYAVYTFASQYADTGQVGVYVGTREDNLVECMKVVAAELHAVSESVREDEVERAKENLKGRIMLSMELTSNRMSRLGKSLVTDTDLLSLDQILAEIDAVDAESVAQLAGVLFATERLSVAGIGTNEDRFLASVGEIAPHLRAARAA